MAEVTLAQAVIAATVVSAGATIYSGRQTAAAEAERRRQLDQQMSQQNIRTLDETLERRRQLALLMGEQAALGAQNGFDPYSSGSSFLALREETEKLAKHDIEMIRLLGANEIGRLNSEKIQSRIAGKAAVTSSYLQAASSAIGGYVDAKSLGSASSPASSPKLWSTPGKQNRRL